MSDDRIHITDDHVLFDDQHYLAIAKERGWLVHATVDRSRPDLFTAAQAYVRGRDGDPYLALHHRLDRWTSGVIVFGRTRAANRVLASVFAERTGVKRYVAVCVGRPDVRGELRHHLATRRDGGVDTVVAVSRGGKPAICRYELVASVERPGAAPLARVAFELVTGRTHQLRVQAAIAGFPILGDARYGDAAANRASGVDGPLLHASSLSFNDPLSGRDLDLVAPEPPDLDQAMGIEPRPHRRP